MILLATALLSAFHIAVFGDNQGDGPGTPPFDNFACWVDSVGPLAIVGTGDHVSNPSCAFLRFLEAEPSFAGIFWPAVADAENACWGRSQADVGAGFPLLGYGAASFASIEGCSYAASLELEGVDVRIVSIHFPDQPADPLEAFTPAAREFLAEVLEDCPDSALVIVVAHSRTGRWDNCLDGAVAALLERKADLLLSGTIHVPLLLPGPVPSANAGSLTRPLVLFPPSFIDLEVAPAESLTLRMMDASVSPPAVRREIPITY
ncbi:hypothetical protein GX411_05145 [Candidatus Fermentibacteria bacterium]|nr:hypothetical protein [Candidatus Fermentibacteria bacterium]